MQPILSQALPFPGMWISPAGRVYLTTGISLAAVAVATWTGMMAGAAVTGRELAYQSRGLFPSLRRKQHR